MASRHVAITRMAKADCADNTSSQHFSRQQIAVTLLPQSMRSSNAKPGPHYLLLHTAAQQFSYTSAALTRYSTMSALSATLLFSMSPTCFRTCQYPYHPHLCSREHTLSASRAAGGKSPRLEMHRGATHPCTNTAARATGGNRPLWKHPGRYAPGASAAARAAQAENLPLSQFHTSSTVQVYREQ
jgi:hypothetical protein